MHVCDDSLPLREDGESAFSRMLFGDLKLVTGNRQRNPPPSPPPPKICLGKGTGGFLQAYSSLGTWGMKSALMATDMLLKTCNDG